MFYMEKMAVLLNLDSRWKEHLLIIDSLKEGIHLRGYAQTEPLMEYQKESYTAFQEMSSAIKEGAVEFVFKVRLSPAKEPEGVFNSSSQKLVHSQYSPLQKEEEPVSSSPAVSSGHKVGRNETCPCGSGKKYKKCCGK